MACLFVSVCCGDGLFHHQEPTVRSYIIAEKTSDPTAALLTTQVLVGDTELELTNGVEVRQAVDVLLQAPRRPCGCPAPGRPPCCGPCLRRGS